jgi:hypothetical protein
MKCLWLLLFVASVALAEDIVFEYEITNVVSTLYLFDTRAEMEEYLEVSGISGYSECFRNEEHNIAYCDIYSVRPTEVDDDPTTTVGHEVLHGVYGADYHED